jgi:putative flippase GtrA
MIKHFISLQFLLFLFVGATAASFHWLARFLLSILLPFPLAVALAYFVGIAVAFILNRRYVFPSSSKPVHKQAREFVIINLFFFPVVLGASIFIREGLIQNGVIVYVDGIAHGLAITIPVFMTFLVYKFITFGDK